VAVFGISEKFNDLSLLINSPYAKPLPLPLPGTERGESQTSPPALSGKGDGGLGRMRKVSYQIPCNTD